MKTHLQSILAAALCAAFATSCGSSSSNETTLELSDGVAIDIVKTPEGLWFGKTEVTQAQWETVMGDNPARFKGENNPVESVSWDECQEFVKKLNLLRSVKKAGLTFRLPTDEEWEYACRAGGTGKYCKLADGTEIAEDNLCRVAWFDDNSGDQTHPVGQLQSNAFGLCDMLGNVQEWTSTTFREYRSIRGGNWESQDRYCKFSKRAGDLPSYRDEYVGFRLCAEYANGKRSNQPRLFPSVSHSFPSSNAAAESILASMVDIPGKDFKIGKTEVTQAQWEAVMGDNPSWFKGADNPVESVSWEDCQEFLEKLNTLPAVRCSGLTCRLPSEEEWEFACRADATGEYCRLANGTEIERDTLDQVAWYEDNAGGKTHPVGQKKPNAFGLYDMHGNVKEWTSSGFEWSENRVERGGSCFDSAGRCEPSSGGSYEPSFRHFLFGFRLCAEPTVK